MRCSIRWLRSVGIETCGLDTKSDAILVPFSQILTTYKGSMTAGGAGVSAQLAIADNLKMLPILVLGLLKNVRDLLKGFCWNLEMLIPGVMTLGWPPPKCPNSARYQGVLSGLVDFIAFPTLGPLSVPYVLFVTQHAS